MGEPHTDSMRASAKTTLVGAPTRRWYQRLGPGLITACVVIGPGSILTSSNVGAHNGYSMFWVVVTSVIFMLVYMSLGAKLARSRVSRSAAWSLNAQGVLWQC